MSWDQLAGIIEEARDLDTEERNRVPEDCPRCGAPLVDGPPGVQLFCRDDGWQYPRDA